MSAAPSVSRLADRMDGEMCMPGSPGYDRATTPNNSTTRQEPAAVAVVEGADDVSACVLYSAEADLRVTMQATGHGAAGDLGADTLLVDTHRLDEIEVGAGAPRTRWRPLRATGSAELWRPTPWTSLQPPPSPHAERLITAHRR